MDIEVGGHSGLFMRRFYGGSHWETLHFTPQTLPSLISDSSQQVHDVSNRQNQPGIIEIKGLKTSTLRKAKQLHWTGEKKVQWGMSNVLKVSLQTTIYSLGLSWMVAATNCERVGDQLRNGTPVSAAGKTGHFDRRF